MSSETLGGSRYERHRLVVCFVSHLRVVLILCVAMVACFSGGCDGNATGEIKGTNAGQLSGKITLSGSSTAAPLVTEIAKRFESLQPGVRIDVQTGGSGKGIADVRLGMADIGMASRSLQDDEKDLTAHQIAADGVGLIVHQSNPIQELTTEQVIAIYTDQVNDWQQVGGPDQQIIVVHKAEGRATLEVFLAHFALSNPAIKADVIVGDNEHGVKTVAGAVGAIGYVSIGTAEANIAMGAPLRLLPLAGVPASTDRVASGEFPMSRPLNLVTKSAPSPLAEAFIHFCQSSQVHDLVESQYFCPVARETDVTE